MRRIHRTALVVLAAMLQLSPFAGAVDTEWGYAPLHLTFAGDIMHHDLIAAMDNYDLLYDSVRETLSQDDLSFANIEFPVDPSRPPSGFPQFNGTIEYVSAAIRGGLDVFSLANNHSFDWGAQALNQTREIFDTLARQHGVYHSGLRAGRDRPIELTVIRVDRWRIGFVAVTTFSNVWGAEPYVNSVNYRSETERQRFLDMVAEWRNGVDLLVVSIHAGVEYSTEPDPEKVRFFRDVAYAGADIVWGHHPHVLQPWEVTSAPRPGCLIIYSAGNFVSAQRRYQHPGVPLGRWAATGDAALFQVRVSMGAGGPEIELAATPLLTTVHRADGLVVRRFDEVLSQSLSIEWLAFYLARFAAARRLVVPSP
jgi:hypothetical protein